MPDAVLDGFLPIIPVNISFTEWAQELTRSCPNEPIPLYIDESSWKDWVNEVKLNRAFDPYKIPDPYFFSDWREWAAEFLLSIGV